MPVDSTSAPVEEMQWASVSLDVTLNDVTVPISFAVNRGMIGKGIIEQFDILRAVLIEYDPLAGT
jgi:hypothetical protein